MLKTRIYASQVSNLSDARYFAAWGVEYIGFLIGSNLNTQSIKEMMDWVEGPEYIAEIEGLDSTPAITDSIAELELNKITTSAFFSGFLPPSSIQIPTQIFPNTDYLEEEMVLKFDIPYHQLTSTDFEQIKTLTTKTHIWIDIDFSPKELQSLLDTIKPYGLVIRGGEEEKVGLKNFEDLDEIFELLEVD